MNENIKLHYFLQIIRIRIARSGVVETTKRYNSSDYPVFNIDLILTSLNRYMCILRRSHISSHDIIIFIE